AGYRVTAGAAAGYLEDRVCGTCHRDLWRSYQEVGMARSFFRPRAETAIEDFAAPPFVHAASRQRFSLRRSADRLLFRRDQLAPDGQPINVFEQEVDWILGSGNHARTYLYRTPGGELYQLPLAWYTQSKSWGMAPGFDRPDHQGVLRRVRRECMFCHNAYPDVPAESDAYGAPHLFPGELPEGTGCQRCHGPGAEHVRRAFGGADVAAVRAAVVNPGRLPPERRDEVCFQCHLQPSVAVPGVLRFGRGDYSFRPGEPLAAHRLDLEVVEEGQQPEESFEINHHPYRLRQSRCFQASGARLNCLTCHDPHRKVAETERAAHFRAACLSCHREDACTGTAHGAGGAAAATPGVAASDCVSCHMAKRRTQDVVHVVMTDHRIARRPGGPELLAPLVEREPVLVDLRWLDPAAPPSPPLGEVYRAAALLRVSSSSAAVEHLEKTLPRAAPEALEPALDLARGQLAQRRFASAERTLASLLAVRPGHAQAEEWLAVALAGQGRRAEAVATLRRLLARDPARPEALANLGHLLLLEGRTQEAMAPLEGAVALRPVLLAAWLDLGRIERRLGRPREAAARLQRALAIEPGLTEAYLELGRALLAAGEPAAAERFLRHGAVAAREPERVAAALAALPR
ncbi:MAG TPA: tetratricopeptide repeat protein, partial [Thermoanaerobaculia bacterium]|nr:tetratricopeptide repeat protein [Thermoanaerobaculia bacterium]